MQRIQVKGLLVAVIMVVLAVCVIRSITDKPRLDASTIQMIEFSTLISMPKEKQVTEKVDISKIVDAINSAATSPPFVDASSGLQMQIKVTKTNGSSSNIIFTENCIIVDSQRYKVDKHTLQTLQDLYKSIKCVECRKIDYVSEERAYGMPDGHQ